MKVSNGLIQSISFLCGTLIMLRCGDSGTNPQTPSLPQITTPLAAVTKVFAGNPTALTIAATGSSLTYQWYFNGTAIIGATADSYSKTWAVADSGTYKIVISNASGKDSSSTQLEVISLQDFFMTNQISGWVTDSSSHFVQYPPESLYGPINGAATFYVDSGGLVCWCREEMNGGDQATPWSGDYVFNGYIHDYGTPNKAKWVFNAKSSRLIAPDEKISIPPFTDNEVQAKLFYGGMQAIANFGKFYFEVIFMGYQDSTDAVPEAVKFLTKYKALVF
jgi:hypothetical protein